LVKTERGLSTAEILRTESQLIKTVNAACDSVGPLHCNFKPADSLGEDQQRAIYHILRTSDRITGLRGLAGTGKTTALRELVAACQEGGIEPLFCAPTAAATDVLRKEGFEARTLQSLLQSPPALSAQHLIVLDEAGAVGIDDMKRLFELAKDCRVVLSGDTGQHASVARGDALRILERHSNFKSGQLTQIRRQRKAEYRKAVELAAKKETALAFAQLERMRAVVESSQVHDSATRAYLKALEQNRSALLVAPAWSEIEAVTETIRAALKASGRLVGDEAEFQVFDSLSWTEAQMRDARQYRPGMAIRFHRRQGRFENSESVTVVGIESDSLKVIGADGVERSLHLRAGAACFDVGEHRHLKIAAGDKLLLQSNALVGRRRFVNGELVEVAHLAGDGIVLTDGRIIPASYRTFTHGYAVTSHAAQGKTVDEVLVVASSRSLPAVSQEQFYVSISRGRERCQVFTDDVDRLRSHVTHSSERLAAVEVIPRVGRLKFIQHVLERGHRFLKHFRQRVTQSHSLRKGIEHIRETSYEHQRQSRSSLRV
jgi:ATP-dependent exoDNAse (exonuclease V) alpha subunit